MKTRIRAGLYQYRNQLVDGTEVIWLVDRVETSQGCEEWLLTCHVKDDPTQSIIRESDAYLYPTKSAAVQASGGLSCNRLLTKNGWT